MFKHDKRDNKMQRTVEPEEETRLQRCRHGKIDRMFSFERDLPSVGSHHMLTITKAALGWNQELKNPFGSPQGHRASHAGVLPVASWCAGQQGCARLKPGGKAPSESPQGHRASHAGFVTAVSWCAGQQD